MYYQQLVNLVDSNTTDNDIIYTTNNSKLKGVSKSTSEAFICLLALLVAVISPPHGILWCLSVASMLANRSVRCDSALICMFILPDQYSLVLV